MRSGSELHVTTCAATPCYYTQHTFFQTAAGLDMAHVFMRPALSSPSWTWDLHLLQILLPLGVICFNPWPSRGDTHPHRARLFLGRVDIESPTLLSTALLNQ
ncbi:hypothetical protein TgHK011_008547 [Trichoderma gracile]|nr:hypothetical protein TgHK011_008547 [Trichoderma gracile]